MYLAFIFWACLSLLWGTDLSVVIKQFVQYIEFILFAIIINYYFAKINLNKILNVFLFVVSSVAIYYILVNLLKGNFIGMKISSNKIIPGLAATLYFSRFLFNKKKIKASIIIIILMLFTFLTFERKSWVALSFSIMFQIFIYNKYVLKRKKILSLNKSNFIVIVIIVTIFATIFGLFFVNDMVNKQILSLISIFSKDPIVKTASNSARIDILEKTFFMIKDNPILGIGLENFKAEYLALTSLSSVPSTHSEFLSVWVSLGIIGLIMFLMIWLYPLKLLIALKKYKNQFNLIQKRNIIFIYGIWIYGFFINLFRGTGVVNLAFMILPITFTLIFEYQNKKILKR